MRYIECENGHFYNADMYKKCPFCKEEKKRKGKKHHVQEEQVRELDYGITVAKGKGERISGCIFQSLQAGAGGMKGDFDKEKTVSFYSGRKGNRLLAGWLVCLSGNARGRDYRIYYGNNDIGRGSSMDISIPEDMNIAADRHCSIVYDANKMKCYLVPHDGDATMRNGELVTKPSLFAHGDVLEIGMSKLEYVDFCKGERKWEEG